MAHAPDNVIEALQFPDVERKSPSNFDGLDYEFSCKEWCADAASLCLLCQQEFKLPSCSDVFHRHLLEGHRLVIQEPHLISDLNKYVEYWRKRFSQEDHKCICSEHTDQESANVQYRLGESIPEDHQLREYLQRKRLDAVLATQQAERDDMSLSRSCLFCRESFTGNRAELFNHMAFSHSFNVGQPDNIVFANEFLDLLERILASLQCLYCEKIFRDRTALKDHMRKKQHRRLNPNNKAYDKFYVINYLEAGKDWQEVQAEKDVAVSSPDSGDEESWADWEDDLCTDLVCLFCKHSSSAPVHDLLTHMVERHGFDFFKFRDKHAMNFYDQVKLVNFIRRCVHQGVCAHCDEKFEAAQSLTEHLVSHRGHMDEGLQRSKWDQPQFLFPMYENDALLCSLEDVTDDEDEEDASTSHSRSPSSVPILAEDQRTS